MIEESRTNWAGNHAYSAAGLHYPENVEQVRGLVGRNSKVKALGSRHSFNDVADSPGELISLDRFKPFFSVDREQSTVTVSAGIRYGELARQLHDEGYALHNMASLPHISVAGAVATATHGSGDRNGNLATIVSAVELVTAEGDMVRLSRSTHPEEFAGAVVALGGLGVVTRLTLDVVPTYDMRQDVYENLLISQMETNFEIITSAAYSVSLLTNWRNNRVNQVWLKRPVVHGETVELQPELFGATLASTHLHPIPGLSSEPCTEQMGIPGRWYERLPHFRMGFTPSSGEELQTEYLIPRRHAVAAFRALHGMGEYMAPLLQISELRTVAQDDLWMSPCYREPCVAIHFTWKKDWDAVQRVIPVVEEQLAPMEARPHWGKLFTMPPSRVQSLFPRLPDFQKLLSTYDPGGKFRNRFLDTYIF